MAGPVRLPTGLPTALTPGVLTVYTATATDALSPAYGATATSKILQVATVTDAQEIWSTTATDQAAS